MENKLQKILITSPSLDANDNISGISTITKLLIENNRGVEYEHFVLGRKDNTSRRIGWLLDQIKTPFRLFSLFREKSIDIVHFNIGFEPPSLLRDIGLYLYICYLHIPVVLHIHGGRYMNHVPENIIFRNIIIRFLRNADSIIVLSKKEQCYLSTNFPFVENKVEVISNAVETSSNDVSKKDYFGMLKILFLGRIDKNKGLSVIASVLNELSAKDFIYKFHLCGVGPDKEWFIGLLSDKAKQSLVDEGLLTGQHKKELLEKSHIFLLPSLFEGLPMALLETMSYGVVPLVTAVGSIPTVVKDGINGYFIKENVFEIINRIIELDEDRCLLEKLSNEDKKEIQDNFSIVKYVDRVNSIYRRVLV